MAFISSRGSHPRRRRAAHAAAPQAALLQRCGSAGGPSPGPRLPSLPQHRCFSAFACSSSCLPIAPHRSAATPPPLQAAAAGRRAGGPAAKPPRQRPLGRAAADAARIAAPPPPPPPWHLPLSPTAHAHRPPCASEIEAPPLTLDRRLHPDPSTPLRTDLFDPPFMPAVRASRPPVGCCSTAWHHLLSVSCCPPQRQPLLAARCGAPATCTPTPAGAPSVHSTHPFTLCPSCHLKPPPPAPTPPPPHP
jgi:hypothetical protein